MSDVAAMPKSAKIKAAIASVIYGIVGVIATAVGIVLIVAGYDTIAGIFLIMGGIAGFGISCYTRPWMFNRQTCV